MEQRRPLNAPVSPSTRIGARVLGRVQGVGFRYFVCDQASGSGLRGWVRNTPDGAVELEAEGPADRIHSFITVLHQGPPLSRVADVQICDLPVVKSEQGFEIR